MKELSKEIPENPGVYFFIDGNNNILYIGKSINLRKRIYDHFHEGKSKTFVKIERENNNFDDRVPLYTWDYTTKYLEKIPSLVYNKERKKKMKIINKTQSIKYILTETDGEAFTLEGCLIAALRPILNRMTWQYPFIEITLGEEIPRVLINYQILEKDSYVFGPFNIAAKIDQAIEGFLMVFPICDYEKSVKCNSKHLPNCIKHQINRCLSPCKKRDILTKYHEFVEKFIVELEHNGKGVITELHSLMNDEIEKENFEGAAIIRDRIQAIETLFNQKAIPTVLEKYYEQVKEIIGKKANQLEIIDKILINNFKNR